MIITMANVTFFRLSKKVGGDGKAQVIIRVTIDRMNRPVFKSGVFVRPEFVKIVSETSKGTVLGIVPPKKGRFNVAEYNEATKAKSALDDYMSRMAAVCNAMGTAHMEMTKESIETALLATRDIPNDMITYRSIIEGERSLNKGMLMGDKDLIGWYAEFVSKHGKKLSESRYKQLEVLGRMLGRYQSFIKATSKNGELFKLDIDAFDKDMVEDFHDYLINEKELSEQYPNVFERLIKENPAQMGKGRQFISERGKNVLIVYMKILKEFFRWLNEQGCTSNNPFAMITLEQERYGTPFYLTLEERNEVANADISALWAEAKKQGQKLIGVRVLEDQRDIFIFQCCVGCRVSDLEKFIPSNIDKGVLTYIPKKTIEERVQEVRVPLNSRAAALVKKYAGRDKKGRLFPFVASTKYNKCIKQIMQLCGIDRKITKLNPVTGEEEQHPIWEVASSHMARRTFIGNLYREVKDPNLIGSMSGHVAGSKAFARYRTIDDDTKKDVVSLID